MNSVAENFPNVQPETKPAVSRQNTLFLQATAALLIANSHLEGLYPRSWMAADGFIGNSLFFLLSGYGITLSLTGKKQSFISYYLRRILRIYPALLLVEIIFHFGFGGKWQSANWQDYVRFLIYPTAYGYVRQIMVFYAIFYCFKKWLAPAYLLKLSLALSLLIFGFFCWDFINHPLERLQLGKLNDWLWYGFFFQMMLLGGWLALRQSPNSLVTRWKFLGLAFLFAIYVGLKFLMVTGVKVPFLQMPWARFYLLLFMIIPVLLYFAFDCATSAEWLKKTGSGLLAPVIAFVGGLTLEIYLVHVFVFENEQVRKLFFPLNIVVFFIVTLALAWMISKMANLVRSRLERS